MVAERLFFAFSFGIGKQALREAQISLNLPVQQLRVESKCLCCSWYWSLKRILDQKPAIEKVFKEYRYFTLASPPNQEQYDDIENICQVLAPLVDVIEKSSNYKYAIVSTFLPLIKQITESLEIDSFNSELSDLAAQVKFGLSFGLKIILLFEKDSFALKASFLDPRFKNLLQPDEQQSVLIELADSLFHIVRSEINQTPVNFPAVNQQISKEIDNYLTEPVIDDAEDPLKWWRNKQLQYRYLAKLARKYLCCSALCCCDQNSYFKHSELQPFPSGSHLLPDGANMLTFLSRNS